MAKVEETSPLWRCVRRQSRLALASGALRPIDTDYEIIDAGALRFVLRIVSSLKRKARLAAARTGGPPPKDPFMPPYEQDLYVGEVGAGHVALLNKFNVLADHLLLVTRDYQPQDTWLDPTDFEALWTALRGCQALGFYNGGEVAGASQPHKHLQVVPLPLGPAELALPMAAALAEARPRGDVMTTPRLPFCHAIVPVSPAWLDDPARGGREGHRAYERLLRAVGLAERAPSGGRQTGPYNLLVCRRWMWLVPRSSAEVEGIAVNALAYAGALLAHDRDQAERIRALDPLAILARAATAAPRPWR